ncbi:MAG: hypothetical protein ACRDZ4_14480 [Egibacteraceae bacterium]
MARRLLGVMLLLVMLCALGPVGIATAAQQPGASGGAGEHAPLPGIDEIGSRTDIAKQYLPEPYQEPSWFQWALFPLLIVGVLATLTVLFAYLVWQPKFAGEQKTKKRRR